MMLKRLNTLCFFMVLLPLIWSCTKVQTEDIPYKINLNNDYYEVNQGSSIEINFLSNDIIEGETINVSLLNEVENGSLVQKSNSTLYTYVANPNFEGIEKFNYQVCVNNYCKIAEVKIKVMPIPDSCIAYAVADYYTTKNSVFSVDIAEIIQNDVSPCSEWNSQSFKATLPPQFGVISITNNTLRYNANTIDWSKDKIQYEICNYSGICKKSTIHITNGDVEIATQL